MIDEILSFWPPPAREILDAGNWSRAAGTAKRRDVAEKRGRNCDVPIKERGRERGSSVVCRYHPQKRTG